MKRYDDRIKALSKRIPEKFTPCHIWVENDNNDYEGNPGTFSKKVIQKKFKNDLNVFVSGA